MRHKILVGFAVFLCLLFLTVIGVPAKTRLRPGALLKGNIGVVFTTTDEINNIGTLPRGKLRTIRLSKLDKVKPKIPSSKTCGCVITEDQDLDGFGSCFKQCLQSWGVSAVTLAGCAAVCAGDNLVGCAICVGVQEWIVLGCAQYCAWTGSGGGGHGIILSKNMKHGLRRVSARNGVTKFKTSGARV